jgi:hypothetical protein
MTIQLLVLLVLALTMLVLGAVKQEFRSSGYWFQATVAVAILFYFGLRLA